ncbi:GTA head formation protein, RCAP_rcc01685 family [Meridianimarinicoccus aquatilis]|uniref:Gene transfer agent protein n=1 Tax=Meridianimarinicoccus aquatilis TaxID=2552766 RepID=A0A4R6AV76_9RHOB|nr:hypothetical protein [Fluviibacterium aquatile]QIE41640.1 hypothetical protein G5B39_06535 [Rhodobacteraceae bacterium SC52]TDL88007.1 hypothetical protein E2L05_09655 [Fluviibacterium aquatile]
MSDLRRPPGGSRFLYEPFDYGPAQVREAHEKLLQMQFEGIDGRLTRIELLMERLEKRLWLTVYGVVATILAQAVSSLVTVAPNGGM